MNIHQDGRISFYIESDTESAEVLSAAPIPINVYTHIVVTMNTVTGEMRCYINGSLSGSTTTTVRPLVELDPAQNPGIGIGNSGAFPNTSYNFPFPGSIDEMSLYNRALTAAEVQNLYDAGSGGKCDALPSLAVNNPTPVAEGSASTPGAVTFNVTLSFPITQPVTVNYSTADGATNGATAGSDYIAASGTLTFAPGETSKTVRVNFIGDDVIEPDETFFLNLSNAVNADISEAEGTATVVNDEAGPAISINDVSVKEGNSATTAVNFTVTLSEATPLSVQVDYSTLDANATAPADYNAANGTIIFAPGETSKTITVFVRGDTFDEVDELFRVNLSNPVNATLGDQQGLCTIIDDDVAPSASVDDVTVVEGNSGTVNATFTITLSAPSGQTVTVNAIPSMVRRVHPSITPVAASV